MPHDQFDLVFEGGGAKGSTFVGALSAFYQRGGRHRRLIGTSAGAITATLLAAGFTPEEMRNIVNEKLPDGTPRFSSFMDKPSADFFNQEAIENSDIMRLLKDAHVPTVPDRLENKFDEALMGALLESEHFRQIFCFIEFGGLYAGAKFITWIEEQLNKKGLNVTLKDFHDKVDPNNDGTNELSLVASDTDGPEMLVLNHRTAPDCPVSRAVRMSMSIPFVWREVVWKQEWGTYLGKDISGHRIVDGGVLSNFPIALIDKQPLPGSLEEKIMGKTTADETGTIGLLIDETIAVEGQQIECKRSLSDKVKAVKRVNRLVDTMSGVYDAQEMERHKDLVCRLPAQSYGTTEFDMDDTRLWALINAGKAAMERYLDANKLLL